MVLKKSTQIGLILIKTSEEIHNNEKVSSIFKEVWFHTPNDSSSKISTKSDP